MATITVAINRVEGPNDRGWFEIYDQPGKKYSTKDAPLVALAQSLVGQMVNLEYNESQTPNPKGGFYINRYFQGATPATLTGAAGSGLEAVTGVPSSPQGPSGIPLQGAGVMSDDREKRIMRQTASKVAVHLLAFIGPEEQGTAKVIEYAERLVRYYETGE